MAPFDRPSEHSVEFPVEASPRDGVALAIHADEQVIGLLEIGGSELAERLTNGHGLEDLSQFVDFLNIREPQFAYDGAVLGDENDEPFRRKVPQGFPYGRRREAELLRKAFLAKVRPTWQITVNDGAPKLPSRVFVSGGSARFADQGHRMFLHRLAAFMRRATGAASVSVASACIPLRELGRGCAV